MERVGKRCTAVTLMAITTLKIIEVIKVAVDVKKKHSKKQSLDPDKRAQQLRKRCQVSNMY